MTMSESEQIYCDTHVHCYQFKRLPELLDNALENFVAHGAAAAKVLFFTDGEQDRTWEALRPLTTKPYRFANWSLHFSPETRFIHANNGADELLLAPARQLNSKNRLEYLLLGCDQECEAGLDDRALVEQFADSYAVICPWGVGKWLGARGKLLSQLLYDSGSKLLLGDNGGRPSIWAWVPQFKVSAQPVINGSDPLPIAGELSRIADFGIVLDPQAGPLTLASLVQQIKLGEHQNYGNHLGLLRFLKAQFQMSKR